MKKRGRDAVAHGNPAKRRGTRPMTQANRNAHSDTKNEHEMNANQTTFTKKGFFHVQPQERFRNEFREPPARAVERRRRNPPVSADVWNELEKAGKAFDYENRNWKNRTRILFCTESEAAPFFRTPAEGSRFELGRLGGLVSALPNQRRGKTLQHLWVRETEEPGTALRVLVHEAIHAASFASAARRIPLDLRDEAAGDCVGFFVEDILTQALPFFERKLGIRGANLPRRGTRKDRLAVRGGKGATLKR